MPVVLLLSFVLFSFSHYGHASKGKVKSRAKKVRSKQVHNMLHPFTLRLLYTPSYRFLSEYMRDGVEESKDREKSKASIEIAQFLPISMGLEGEFAFNQWISLALSGGFTWQKEFMTWQANSDELKKIFEEKGFNSSSKFYEYVVGSTLYGNMFNYFKLGVGAELGFRNWDHVNSQTEEKNKWEERHETTWKRVSAHLALRRDFFLARVGFGVGFNASLSLGDMLDRQMESKYYLDGKLQEQEEGDDVDKTDDDGDEDEGIYAMMLMPMLYVAF